MLQFEEGLQLGRPADQFQRMLRDPAYFERKYREMRVPQVSLLAHEAEDELVRASVRFAVPVGRSLPAIAQRFVGDELVITQHETWDFAKGAAQIRQEIRNVPAGISAEIAFADRQDGVQVDMHWQVSAQVPLIGGKLEKIIVDTLRLMIKGEFRIVRKLIVEY